MLCVVPLGTASAKKASVPSYNKVEPSDENVVDELADPQVSWPSEIPHSPLLLFSVKLSAEPEAVIVAHVPLVYQEPLEMIQPFWLPDWMTLR